MEERPQHTPMPRARSERFRAAAGRGRGPKIQQRKVTRCLGHKVQWFGRSQATHCRDRQIRPARTGAYRIRGVTADHCDSGSQHHAKRDPQPCSEARPHPLNRRNASSQPSNTTMPIAMKSARYSTARMAAMNRSFGWGPPGSARRERLGSLRLRTRSCREAHARRPSSPRSSRRRIYANRIGRLANIDCGRRGRMADKTLTVRGKDEPIERAKHLSALRTRS